MADFAPDTIKVRYNTDNYGPFVFNFSNVVFSGDSISSVNVRAFLGNVKPSDDLTAETEVDDLIDDEVIPSVVGDYVYVYFEYPGDEYKGEKFTLVFEITYTNETGVHPYFFQYVKVE